MDSVKPVPSTPRPSVRFSNEELDELCALGRILRGDPPPDEDEETKALRNAAMVRLLWLTDGLAERAVRRLSKKVGSVTIELENGKKKRLTAEERKRDQLVDAARKIVFEAVCEYGPDKGNMYSWLEKRLRWRMNDALKDYKKAHPDTTPDDGNPQHCSGWGLPGEATVSGVTIKYGRPRIAKGAVMDNDRGRIGRVKTRPLGYAATWVTFTWPSPYQCPQQRYRRGLQNNRC
ncbi:MAG TPA: hypothetical protein VKM54_23005 [Myxococcota bacterium]|nr:hypothetical protein [Myxococcota bacterium]